MSEEFPTPLLDQVTTPAELRRLPPEKLRQLSDEVRGEVINKVSKTGGHLGAGLGVVELTVALHYVFDTPDDRIVWDVSHQCYPHKILTGRRDRMHTLRQGEGLSGFTARRESQFDPFGAAHSSTSISAAPGFAPARDYAGKSTHVIAVLGDGDDGRGRQRQLRARGAHGGARPRPRAAREPARHALDVRRARLRGHAL